MIYLAPSLRDVTLADHWTALEDSLADLGWPIYVGFADPSAPAQYGVLSTPPGGTPDEEALALTSDFDLDVRFKAVTGTPRGVEAMLRDVRGIWSPNRADTEVAVAGRHVRVRYVRSEFVDVDLDTTITGTGRHPAFGVDTYHLSSQPA